MLPEVYPELDVLVLWLVGTLDEAEELLVETMDEAVEAESKPSGLA